MSLQTLCLFWLGSTRLLQTVNNQVFRKFAIFIVELCLNKNKIQSNLTVLDKHAVVGSLSLKIKIFCRGMIVILPLTLSSVRYLIGCLATFASNVIRLFWFGYESNFRLFF